MGLSILPTDWNCDEFDLFIHGGLDRFRIFEQTNDDQAKISFLLRRFTQPSGEFILRFDIIDYGKSAGVGQIIFGDEIVARVSRMNEDVRTYQQNHFEKN